MYSLSRKKRGQIISGETVKWIIYIALIIAVGFSIRMIFRKASG
jgi:hypothetical protein